jgi:hypothetical protein
MSASVWHYVSIVSQKDEQEHQMAAFVAPILQSNPSAVFEI